MYRQGDVLIVPTTEIPAGLEPIASEGNRHVLARGEATRHAHVIRDDRAALFRDRRFQAIFMLVSGDPVVLEHEEHESIAIPPGTYRLIRQREYRGPANLRVED